MLLTFHWLFPIGATDVNFIDAPASSKSTSGGNIDSLTGGNHEEVPWVPIHFKATFEDDRLRKRTALLTCLPSGIVRMNNIIAKVKDDGKVLEIRVAVPDALTSPAKFLLFTGMESHRFRCANSAEFRNRAFHKSLASCRDSIGDVVWRSFECELDFFSAWKIFIL